MVILLVSLHVFVCLFLIAVILLQAGRGQGLSWGVFGGTPQSILGTKTASFLSRVTTGCAIIFLFTCIGLNIVETQKTRSLFAPQRPTEQVDFSKIKEALEKAEQAQKTSQEEAKTSTPTSQKAAETTSESSKTL
ncbi:MAG: preprotein translocase subunit SecG [Candidatus Omnitrophica bacterium]|nr:preprotein translocase subunit SecG [Candidatus Omnitrophota bacterium]